VGDGSLTKCFLRVRVKGQVKQPLRTAATYYLPEGRFYEAPLVLKKKPRAKLIYAASLSFALSAITVGANFDNGQSFAIQKNTTILRSIATSKNNAPAGIDPITTASVALLENYSARPLSAETAGDKLGVKDPSPDENRINRAMKTEGFARNTAKPAAKLTKITPSRISLIEPGLRDIQKINPQKIASLHPADKVRHYENIAMAIIPPSKPKVELPVPKILAALVNNKTPDSLALAYASTQTTVHKASPFDAILKEKAEVDGGRFIPPIGPDDHSWAATPLPASTFTPKEQKCLAEAIYFEARGESVRGQVAVAQVVLNRVRNPDYPNTICGVVYQNASLLNGCQFSFACDGRSHVVDEMPEWKVAKQIATAVSAGQIWLPDVGSATHYHAAYVRPNWAGSMVKLEKIGLHIFYRTRNGGWS